MKLKLQKDLITFKLSQTEKQALNMSGQTLRENLYLPNAKNFSYALSLTKNGSAALDFFDHEIILQVPTCQFEALSTPSKKGISFMFETLTVTIEVDLFPRKKT